VIGLPGWIPIAVSWAACVGLLANWAAPPEVFIALNFALGALGSFDLKWQGTDVREIRSQGMKESFVIGTEKIALKVARSLSRATWSVSDALPEADSEDDSDNLNTDAVDVIRARISQESDRPFSRPISGSMTPLSIGSRSGRFTIPGRVSGSLTPLSFASRSGMTTPLETTLLHKQRHFRDSGLGA